MATSRKRTRELKKLQGDAAGIWGEQREVLGHSADFWKAAGAEAAEVVKNDVAPRVKAAFDAQVKPAVSSGVASATAAAGQAKEKLVKDVAPAVSAAVASSPLSDALPDLDIDGLKKKGKKLSRRAKRKALKKAAKAARKHPKATKKVAKAALQAKKVQKQVAKKTSKKKGLSGGKVFLIILGIGALAAVVYAAAQTLRADDELWVADDEETKA